VSNDYKYMPIRVWRITDRDASLETLNILGGIDHDSLYLHEHRSA